MTHLKLVTLTVIAMIAFAGNSLLCRLALDQSGMDPASFTTIRLISGAAILWIVVRLRRSNGPGSGNWLSAIALFAYAACFSFAYVTLPAAAGALILFGAVQATMIGHGIWSGERMKKRQLVGLLLAMAGLAGLLWPGLSAPPLSGSVLMLASGIAWGIYSLRGRGAGDATQITAGNFLRGVPFAVVLSLLMLDGSHLETSGVWSAIACGAITSGLGYAMWYLVLPALKSTTAATVQLSVPVIAAFGGVVFLNEAMDLRLVLASVAILGGIALVILEKKTPLPVRGEI